MADSLLLFLPPYSPNFIPIKLAFFKPKAPLRKAADRTVDEECGRYFETAGYGPGISRTCPCVTFTVLVAPIAPNSNYGLKVRVDGAGVEVWIGNLADSTAITELVKTRYAPRQRNNYVPIIIY